MQQATQIQTTRQTPVRTSGPSGKLTSPIHREDTRRGRSQVSNDDGWARRAMRASGFGEAGF